MNWKLILVLGVTGVVVIGVWIQTSHAGQVQAGGTRGLDYMRRFGKALALYSSQNEIEIVTNFGGVPTEHFVSEGVDLRYPLDFSATGWGNVLRAGMVFNQSNAQKFPDVRTRAESAIDLESIVGLPTSTFRGHVRQNWNLTNAIKWNETLAILPDACRWNYQIGDKWATFCMGGYVRLSPDLSVKRKQAHGKMVKRGFMADIRFPYFDGNREQWLRDGVPFEKL